MSLNTMQRRCGITWSILMEAVQRTPSCLLVVVVGSSLSAESALVTLNHHSLNSTTISTWWAFSALKRAERENTLMMETISTGVWRHSVLTVWDYEVCRGFLQPIITGPQKKYRDNLEEGLDKFLMVPEHVQYLARFTHKGRWCSECAHLW